METNNNLLSEDLQVDAIAVSHLKETAMWCKFLGIVGLVISVILAVFSLFAGTLLQSASGGVMPTGSGFTLTVVYLLIAAVYFFLSLYMFRFATNMKQALLTIDQHTFNSALLNLKLAYRIMGVITAIYLCFLALALIFGMGALMFS